MARDRIQTRVSDDTSEAVQKYADENNLSEAEAVRRLVRDSLTRRGYDLDVPTHNTFTHGMASSLSVIQTVLLALLLAGAFLMGMLV